MTMSESSLEIWLLRFFGLSSNSKRRVGVEYDDKLCLEVRSSIEPKMVWKVFSEIQKIRVYCYVVIQAPTVVFSQAVENIYLLGTS